VGEPIENFEQAKWECAYGHGTEGGAPCTYGGLFPTDGYWLALQECTKSHGELCQIRAVCDGADSETRFCDWGEDYIWGVYACLGCAQYWIGDHPEWVSMGRRGGDD
jgi:hypothetical protein